MLGPRWTYGLYFPTRDFRTQHSFLAILEDAESYRRFQRPSLVVCRLGAWTASAIFGVQIEAKFLIEELRE